jgi:hypothetical protein
MTHQIQRGAEHFASATATAATPSRGVTGIELRAAMSRSFGLFMTYARGPAPPPPGWTRGPVSWEPALVGGIVHQSILIGNTVASGGVMLGGNVLALQTCFDDHSLNPTPCVRRPGVVRLDIENRYGHNLRYER